MTRPASSTIVAAFLVLGIARWPIGDAALAQSRTGAPDDPFLCYKSSPSKNTPKFPGVAAVVMNDRFEEVTYELKRASKHLCTPADKNGEGIVDPLVHLRSYGLKRPKTTAEFVGGTLTLVNELGAVTLETKKPVLLMVPTAKDLVSTPTAPDPNTHDVDHYACYKARQSSDMPKFPRGMHAIVSDQFTDPPVMLDVIKPQYLCAPTDKNGEGIKRPTGYLVCYKAKESKGEPIHVVRTGVHLANQFGFEVVDTKKVAHLCVPSVEEEIVSPTTTLPTCGNGVVDDPREECDAPDDASCPTECLDDCTCNQPPQLSAIGPQSVAVGATLHLLISATDPEGAAITLRAGPAPLRTGASFDATSGQFVFQPSMVDVGSVEFEFSATDELGAVDSEQVVVTVSGPAQGAATEMTGRLLDTNAYQMGSVVPIVGATVSLLDVPMSTVTAADGIFHFANIPKGGDHILDLNTSTADPAPDGSPYAGFREAIVLIAGASNLVDRPYFLPRIDVDSLTQVDPAVPTVVHNPNLGVTLVVPAGAAKNLNGTPFTGQLSISRVPANLAPSVMPEILNPDLLVTIQPVGVVFNPMASITFTNYQQAAAGNEYDLWSLDPQLGVFSVVGVNAVSADGATIEPISGGVPAADWHALLPPAPQSEPGDDGCCRYACCSSAPVGSESAFSSGNLTESHSLAPFFSLGPSGSLALTYDSLRADPRPTISSATTIPVRAAVPPKSRISVRIGGTQVDGVWTDTSGLSESVDETIRQVIQVDATQFATGVYPYELQLTSWYPATSCCCSGGTCLGIGPTEATGLSFGSLAVENLRESAVGAGWSIAGLQAVHEQSDGSVLLTQGSRAPLQFTVGDASASTFTILEPGWSVARTVTFSAAFAAHFNPVDGLVYVNRRTGSSTVDGVYRIEANGSVSPRIATATYPAGLVADPATGAIFHSEDFSGIIFRTALGATGRQTWVSTFADGSDDDPVGMAIAPADYSGPFLNPGDAVVVDRGANGGRREVWKWSPAAPEGEVRLKGDDGTLLDCVDVAISSTAIWIVDAVRRQVYELRPDATLKALLPPGTLLNPQGIAIDSLTGDLMVLDVGNHRLVRIDPTTGAVSNVLGNATVSFSWAGIDISPDGRFLVVTTQNTVTILEHRAEFVSPPGDFSQLLKNVDGTFTRTLKDGTRIEFDDRGLQTALVDRNGNTTTYAYDTNGNLITITDPAGQVTNFTYSGGKLASITDPSSRTTSLSHDPRGDLVAIMDPDGTARGFAYDSHHRLVAQTSKRGYTTTYSYDAAGRFRRSVLPDGSSRELYPIATVGLFNSIAGLGSSQNPAPVVRPDEVSAIAVDGNSNVTIYTTDAAGALTGTVDSLGRVTLVERNAAGLPVRITQPRGNGATLTYDAVGNLTRIRRQEDMGAPADDLLDRVTDIAYEPRFNRVKSITDARGNVTTYFFDYELPISDPSYGEAGNLIRIERPADSHGMIPTTHLSYSPRGLITQLVDPNGVVAQFGYDASTYLLDTLVEDVGGLNATTLVDYDPVGNPTAITDAEGRVATFSYDAANRIEQLVDPLGYVTNFFYAAGGDLVRVEEQVDEAASQWRTTRLSHDVLGRLASFEDPIGRITSYDYDLNGNLTSVVNPDAVPTSYAYDERDLTVQRIDAGMPLRATTYEYDDNENLTRIVDAAGSPTTFVYDGFDRRTATEYADGSTVSAMYDKDSNVTDVIMPTTAPLATISYSYDALNRVLSKTHSQASNLDVSYDYDLASRLIRADVDASAGAKNTFTYDNLNRIVANVQVLDGVSHTVGYERDLVGNLTQLVYPSGTTVDYGHDAGDRNVEVRVDGAVVVENTYDPLGRRIIRRYPNLSVPQQAVYQYDLANQRTSVLNQMVGGPDISRYDYPTYDGAGNRTRVDRRLDSDPPDSTVYAYNEVYELVGVSGSQAESYAYDTVGNRASGNGIGYVANAVNQYADVGGVTLAYDANGSLTNDGTRTNTFDAENRLGSVSSATGTASYEYDAFGRRVSSTVNGVSTYFVYGRSDVVAEYGTGGALAGEYVLGDDVDDVLVMIRSGTDYYYHRDGLGSVTELTDDGGSVVERYSYDAFGTSTPTASTIGNPYRFTARRFDEESGMYHYRGRSYDPRLGRYLSRDPRGFVNGVNLYAYVGNNPVNRTDPFGFDYENLPPEEADLLRRRDELVRTREQIRQGREDAYEQDDDLLSRRDKLVEMRERIREEGREEDERDSRLLRRRQSELLRARDPDWPLAPLSLEDRLHYLLRYDIPDFIPHLLDLCRSGLPEPPVDDRGLSPEWSPGDPAPAPPPRPEASGGPGDERGPLGEQSPGDLFSYGH